MRDIYKEIVSLGFNGKLTAFYGWFHKVFPDYSYKRTRNVIEQQAIGNVATIRMKLISPNRLAIHVATQGGVYLNRQASVMNHIFWLKKF